MPVLEVLVMQITFGRFLLLVTLLLMFAACATTVDIKSLDTGADGNPVLLNGKLKKPEGNGPFPAVVLLHGSGGITARRDADWANRLTDWGYVTLQVDSFGPRDVTVREILKNSSKVPHDIRAKDAHGAKSYLRSLQFVDAERIAVMGWSHGGGSTIFSILDKYGNQPFKAAIAFYPYCHYSLQNLKTPLLILTGELDDWCPVWRCREMMPLGETKHEVRLEVFPGAYHDFDWKGINRIVKGHRVLYDSIAAQNAIEQVNNFLATYLK